MNSGLRSEVQDTLECFYTGPLLLLALAIRYIDPGRNSRYHFALLNTASQLWTVGVIKIVDSQRERNVHACRADLIKPTRP